jgi:hypothetical protein
MAFDGTHVFRNFTIAQNDGAAHSALLATIG